MSTSTQDTTDDRRDTAAAWLRARTDLLAALTPDERVLPAIGRLICDDIGHHKRAEMVLTLHNLHTVSVPKMALGLVDV